MAGGDSVILGWLGRLCEFWDGWGGSVSFGMAGFGFPGLSLLRDLLTPLSPPQPGLQQEQLWALEAAELSRSCPLQHRIPCEPTVFTQPKAIHGHNPLELPAPGQGWDQQSQGSHRSSSEEAGNPQEILRDSSGDPQGFLTGFLRDPSGDPQEILKDSSGDSQGSLRRSSGVPQGFLRGSSRVPQGFLVAVAGMDWDELWALSRLVLESAGIWELPSAEAGLGTHSFPSSVVLCQEVFLWINDQDVLQHTALAIFHGFHAGSTGFQRHFPLSTLFFYEETVLGSAGFEHPKGCCCLFEPGTLGVYKSFFLIFEDIT
ncbi:uncharacterized protein LOC131574532 [Poecile atricapillus]|uniref:uncharacterized protein LOC131574532 n=1 Tax=Poecile atricapillus TaxID=48891 RepID=UPI002738CD85|nr:uncharacterized protein LOC131574532 [Poecile atricapillus]